MCVNISIRCTEPLDFFPTVLTGFVFVHILETTQKNTLLFEQTWAQQIFSLKFLWFPTEITTCRRRVENLFYLEEGLVECNLFPSPEVVKFPFWLISIRKTRVRGGKLILKLPVCKDGGFMWQECQHIDFCQLFYQSWLCECSKMLYILFQNAVNTRSECSHPIQNSDVINFLLTCNLYLNGSCLYCMNLKCSH